MAEWIQGSSPEDDPKPEEMSNEELVRRFGNAMEAMHNNSNMSSLADLAQYASQLWWEITGRGGEIK